LIVGERMSRFLHGVFCFVALTALAAVNLPAFAGDKPQPAPSEAEVKKKADEIVANIRLFSKVQKELQKENVNTSIDVLRFLASKDKTSEKAIELIIKISESNLRISLALGSDSTATDDYGALGMLYWRIGNIEKSCENLSKGYELSKKIGDAQREQQILIFLTLNGGCHK
jgi:hypothetical protein